MDLSKITNQTVKQAIEALQANDKNAFYSLFTKDPIFTDDGKSIPFKSFFDNAFNHKERFLDIASVDNDGKSVYGNLFAGQWGTFRVYFKFQQDPSGELSGLDIGQISKMAE